MICTLHCCTSICLRKNQRRRAPENRGLLYDLYRASGTRKQVWRVGTNPCGIILVSASNLWEYVESGVFWGAVVTPSWAGDWPQPSKA